MYLTYSGRLPPPPKKKEIVLGCQQKGPQFSASAVAGTQLLSVRARARACVCVCKLCGWVGEGDPVNIPVNYILFSRRNLFSSPYKNKQTDKNRVNTDENVLSVRGENNTRSAA